jgi:hypothetical protein
MLVRHAKDRIKTKAKSKLTGKYPASANDVVSLMA